MITAHERVQTADNTHELALTFEKHVCACERHRTQAEKIKLKLATELQKQNAYRRAFQILKEIELAHTVVVAE